MTEVQTTFHGTWASMERYITEGEGAADVFGTLGSMAIDAVTRRQLDDLRGRLARFSSRIEQSGHSGDRTDTLKSVLDKLIDTSEIKSVTMLSQEAHAARDEFDSMILEEVAFAQTELGVDEIPEWMRVEIYGRYYPLPGFMREWIAEHRAQFDEQ